MTGPLPRRSFLRGLTTLPLVGGSVALVGAPTGAAEPVTPGMLATYAAWLANEHRSLMWATCKAMPDSFVPCLNPGAQFHTCSGATVERIGLEAQLRAPVVLAAVGCPLTSADAEMYWSHTFRPIGTEGGR